MLTPTIIFKLKWTTQKMASKQVGNSCGICWSVIKHEKLQEWCPPNLHTIIYCTLFHLYIHGTSTSYTPNTYIILSRHKNIHKYTLSKKNLNPMCWCFWHHYSARALTSFMRHCILYCAIRVPILFLWGEHTVTEMQQLTFSHFLNKIYITWTQIKKSCNQ